MKKIAWYWLVVALVLGFRLGADIQHYFDKKVMGIMESTIQECTDFLETHQRTKKVDPLRWVSIDASKRVA